MMRQIFSLLFYLLLGASPFIWFSAITVGQQVQREKTVPTDNYRNRVFAVHNSGGWGTGWVVDLGLKDLYVITAAHVCADEPNLRTSEWGTLPVIFQDKLRDTCLLGFKSQQEQFKKMALEPLRFAQLGPKILDELCAISRVDPSQEKTMCGNVISYSRIKNEAWEADYDSIRHTAPTVPGSSGGPILNAAGEVVCITTTIFLLQGRIPLFGDCAINSEILYSISLHFSS